MFSMTAEVMIRAVVTKSTIMAVMMIVAVATRRSGKIRTMAAMMTVTLDTRRLDTRSLDTRRLDTRRKSTRERSSL